MKGLKLNTSFIENKYLSFELKRFRRHRTKLLQKVLQSSWSARDAIPVVFSLQSIDAFVSGIDTSFKILKLF